MRNWRLGKKPIEKQVALNRNGEKAFSARPADRLRDSGLFYEFYPNLSLLWLRELFDDESPPRGQPASLMQELFGQNCVPAQLVAERVRT